MFAEAQASSLSAIFLRAQARRIEFRAQAKTKAFLLGKVLRPDKCVGAFGRL
jgi:hypothetical protein